MLKVERFTLINLIEQVHAASVVSATEESLQVENSFPGSCNQIFIAL